MYMTKVTSAIVLCAGRGKRLQPHTDTTPKPLLPVNGKPTLDLILDSLKRAGIERVVLVTHYLAEQLERYAQTQAYFPSSSIDCIKQNKLAGTADAALTALEAKAEWFDAPFLLTASDYLVPPEFYPNLVNAYERAGTAIAVSVKRLPDDELAMRSSVRFNTDGAVLEVVEKPAPGQAPSNLSANLVYVLPADIVGAIKAVQPSIRGEKEIQSAINAYLNERGSGTALEQPTPAEWLPGMFFS